jgi:hydroxymethylglutaryl-CoA lyase
MKSPDAEIHIVEVGPRDGLQNLNRFVGTQDKISLIRRLAASGIREIQAGAFVSPRAIPQFSDIKTVVAGLRDIEDVTLTALVPNLAGARDALEAGIRKFNFFFSVSRSHNLNNVRQTRQESLSSLKTIRDELLPGTGVAVRVDLATVFGCPFEGAIRTEIILDYVKQVVSLGFDEITLCDTAGFGHPALIESVVTACRMHFPEVIFGIHLHNTRGLALANALRAYDLGIRSFDASIGGLGGCPFAPGASGNVATEDIVFMFDAMGLSTGINIISLLDVTKYLQNILPDTLMASAVFRAGLPGKVLLSSGIDSRKDESSKQEDFLDAVS